MIIKVISKRSLLGESLDNNKCFIYSNIIAYFSMIVNSKA